ncbi:resolvase, N terminal domain protein [Pseudarthrobacter siccitolerans]|uniref:Resolvase, N terminal domain protein n=1 Tax=Pseudarthrobacter siccitolerans TaxID=861266 RepID=A0A024GY37_9MICC|nr:resolvase, N terminal domain protein [Pseudarthrobacter siccitolerans]
MVDDSTSLDRQEADLRDYADRQGWDVTHVLVDEGMSGRKARAKATEAVHLIRDGEADVLAVWKLDRFTRQGWDGLGELSRALDARALANKPALFVALRDGLDSDQSAFRMIAGVLSEVARAEADNAATRIKHSIAYRKTSTNKYTGGAAVPFGYRSVPAPDGVGRVLVLDEEEAAIVREISGRLLAGIEPLSRICADLQAREIPTSKSPARRALRKGEPADGLDRGFWRASTLRSLFTSDLLMGRVRHHGDLVRDADGLPASVWPPVVDLATLEGLRVRLGHAPSRGGPAPAQPRKGRAARLLSGIAFCAECDSKMYVTSSSGYPIYSCGSSWNGGSCPSPKIKAEALENFVVEHVLKIQGNAPELELIQEADTATRDAALREVEAALREAFALLDEDDADDIALSARIRTLKARRKELREIPVATSSRVVPTGRTLAEAWEAEDDLDWRRSILDWGLDHVTVGPGTTRAGIDPSRVRFYWPN